MTRYRTIVADPPWDHSDGTGFNTGPKRSAEGTRPSSHTPRSRPTDT